MSEAVRVVLVTGAGSGIGAETARRLLADGTCVVAADVSRAGLAALEELDGVSERLLAARCDVADSSQVREVVEAALERFGSLHGLVNAAGVVVTGRFLEFEEEAWERTFRVNVLGTYSTIRYAAPHLKASGRGRIVNFSSIAGKLPNPFTAPYAASKAAVISITRSAAVALAPDVTVNCVCPGIIETPMWEQLGAELGELGAPIDFQSRAAEAPLGRPGRSDDVAGVVVYLLSDDARFMTGEDVNVSGGLVMH